MASVTGVVRLPSSSSTPSCPSALYNSTSFQKIDRNNEKMNLEKHLKISTLVISFPISSKRLLSSQVQLPHSTVVHATLRSPKGFGPSKKTKKTKKSKKGNASGDEGEDEDEEEEEEEEEPDTGIIPEVVTNRMMNRMAFTVGIPLFVGLLFFPFFYYLKVGLKIDVPSWVPFIVSFFFFGSALLGVSYGIVSSSWDPLREGSLLGWTEAQKNWPVFWQSIRGRSGKK